MFEEELLGEESAPRQGGDVHWKALLLSFPNPPTPLAAEQPIKLEIGAKMYELCGNIIFLWDEKWFLTGILGILILVVVAAQSVLLSVCSRAPLVRLVPLV